MIACRSLLRVDLTWSFTSRFQFSKPARYLQRCSYYNQGLNYNLKMGGAKGNHGVSGKKKQKVVAPVWRPVSTQSHSFDGHGEKSEGEILVKEMKSSISSHVSNTEYGKAEVMNEPVEPKVILADLQEKEEGRADEGGIMPSTEKHRITVNAGSSLLRFIKGKEGSTQKKIEQELGVKIKLPSSRKDESIIVEGISADSVARASERIQSIIDEAVKSPTLDYSHFISLPLAIHPELVLKLENFQNSILGSTIPIEVENLETDSNGTLSEEEEADLQLDKAPQVAVQLKTQEDNEHVWVDITNIPLISYSPKASASSTLGAKNLTASDLGIDRSIFIKPKTFHLTVLMLKLWNKERVDAAAEILQSVSAKLIDALDGRPLSIRLKGLECMKGSLAKARVLYAPVEEVGGEDRLLQACKIIIDSFVKGGLVLDRDANQTLKLHATLMNARHRKRGKRRKRFDSFDARGIVKQYGTEEWGEYAIREAHLSERYLVQIETANVNLDVCYLQHGGQANFEILYEVPNTPPHLNSPSLRPFSQPTSPRISFTATASKLDDLQTTSRCICSVLKKDGQILSIAVSNGLVYTGSQTNVIRVWKLPEFTECGQLKSKASMVVALEVSNDRIYAAYADCKIRVWRRTWEGVIKHTRLATIPKVGSYVRSYLTGKDKMMKHMGPISSVAINTSEDILYSAAADRTVKVWRLSDLKCIETIQAHSEPINAITVADDGVLYTASDDATVRVWRRNVCSGDCPHSLTVTLPAKSSPVKTLSLTADGGVLYGGCSDGYVHYWLKGWFSGQLQRGGSLQGHTHAVMCLATVGNYVVSGSADSTSRVWFREQSGDGQHVCIAVLRGHRGPIRCIASFPMRHVAEEDSEDGCTVCTGSLDGVIKVWRVKSMGSSSTCLSSNQTGCNLQV